MRETELVKACLDILKMKKIFYYRNNTGALRTEKGGFVRFGSLGSPDIIAIEPKTGRFIGIECKVGKNSLSLNQRLFKTACEEAGGLYLEIRSPEDLLLKL